MGFSKIMLNLNGAERSVVFDPEKDMLSDVLRRMGLTGTKVGCGAGQCGVCSVLVNGEVVRSCVKKMKSVEPYSRITTIEGIGTPDNLHPLQQAWITYGGVQCGFCSPGFIVSAKGLLDQNPSPTREEVREWFHRHKNLCRCTGYKPLVDAVMAAAGVLRGELTMKDITYKIPADGKILGTKYPGPNSLAKVTGTADYGDDIAAKLPESTLHLAVVQAKVSHANIKGIDFAEAGKMPGVVKIITAADVPGNNRVPLAITFPRSLCKGFDRPILCDKKVFYYGDVVALVAADTREHAREAAKAVKLDLELLPAYMNLLDAVVPDAIRIHEEFPNLYFSAPLHKGKDTREVFPEAAYSVEGSFYAARQPHMPIEPETAQAYMDENGNMTVQCKGQTLYDIKREIAGSLGLDPEKVRVVQNPTGASFGYSVSSHPGILVALGALATGSPVTLTMSWPEFQHQSGKRAPAYCNGKLGCDKNGKITAMEYDLVFDNGAYTETSDRRVWKGLRYMGFPYDIPNIMALSRTGLSNQAPGTAYRCFGGAQAYTASEILVDMLAEKAGMDPFEFRYENVARPGGTMINSNPYLEYPMEEMMDKLRPYYKEAVEKAKAESADKKKRGVGVAWGGYSTSGPADQSKTDIELTAEGVTIYNSWEQMGQGADNGTIVMAHEALRPLGIRPEQIKLVQNDTAFTPETGIAGGSRCNYMVGNTIARIAKQLVDAMRKPDGSYRTYEEMKAEGIPTKYFGHFRLSDNNYDPPLSMPDWDSAVGNPHPEWGYMLFLAEVEVDTDTGKTTVLGITGITDVGVVCNALALEGQVFGGIAHSIGYALSEEYSNPKKHSTMIGAGFPQCLDIPDKLDIIYNVTPRKNHPFGAAGASETFQSSGHVAVLNAIYNAVGVRICETPATPGKVKAAMEAKAREEDYMPESYYFGSDFYEVIDEMTAKPVGAILPSDPRYNAEVIA
jgi:aldehyde oxidoreductase